MHTGKYICAFIPTTGNDDKKQGRIIQRQSKIEGQTRNPNSLESLS